MKKLFSFVIVAVLAVLLAGCDKYDDTELRNKVNAYESRIAALESLSSYKDLLQKLGSGKTVTSCSQSGNEITLTFSDNSTVKFNVQGPQGNPGAPLTWDDLTEAQKAALQGAAGEPGKTPKFKIENETWKVSYDDGATWSDVGSAIDRSLIKAINNDTAGSTLYLTLADGTVIPVFYGTAPEKEPYGLTLAKHTVCGLEDLTAIREREYTIPYTLTGDLKNIDDVTFSINVTSHSYYYIPWSQRQAFVEPVDAKSGVIKIYHKGYVTPGSSNGRTYTFEDGEWYIDYPEMDIEVVAYFPDGTTRVEKIHALSLEFYASPDDNDDYIEWSEELNNPWKPIPSTAGDYSFRVRVTSFDYYLHDDLAEPTLFAFDEIFKAEQSSPIFDYHNPPTTTGPVLGRYEDDLTIKYVVTYHYTAKTGSGTRKSSARIWKRASSNSSYNFMYIQFVQ